MKEFNEYSILIIFTIKVKEFLLILNPETNSLKRQRILAKPVLK